MTREILEADLVQLREALAQLNRTIRQATADANATKGAIQYIESKLHDMKDKDNGDLNRDDPDSGSESTRGDDGTVLER